MEVIFYNFIIESVRRLSDTICNIWSDNLYVIVIDFADIKMFFM